MMNKLALLLATMGATVTAQDDGGLNVDGIFTAINDYVVPLLEAIPDEEAPAVELDSFYGRHCGTDLADMCFADASGYQRMDDISAYSDQFYAPTDTLVRPDDYVPQVLPPRLANPTYDSGIIEIGTEAVRIFYFENAHEILVVFRPTENDEQWLDYLQFGWDWLYTNCEVNTANGNQIALVNTAGLSGYQTLMGQDQWDRYWWGGRKSCVREDSVFVKTLKEQLRFRKAVHPHGEAPTLIMGGHSRAGQLASTMAVQINFDTNMGAEFDPYRQNEDLLKIYTTGTPRHFSRGFWNFDFLSRPHFENLAHCRYVNDKDIFTGYLGEQIKYFHSGCAVLISPNPEEVPCELVTENYPTHISQMTDPSVHLGVVYQTALKACIAAGNN